MGSNYEIGVEVRIQIRHRTRLGENEHLFLWRAHPQRKYTKF